MNRRGKNLIISLIVVLLVGTMTFPVKTISGAVISNNFTEVLFSNLQGWFLFLVMIFISMFLVLNIASRGSDSLQKRLEEMEIERGVSSSARVSVFRPSTWLGRVKYLVSRKRYVEQSLQDEGKYVKDSTYGEDTQKVLSNYGDSRLVEYFIRTKGEMPRDSADKATEYFNDFKSYNFQFNKELEKFPKEDREKILSALASQNGNGVTPLGLQRINPLHTPKDITFTDPNQYAEYRVTPPSDVADSLIAVRLGRGLPYSKAIRTPANDIRTGKRLYERNRAKEGGKESYETLNKIGRGNNMNPRQAVHFSLNSIYTGKHRAYDWAADKVDHILLAPAKDLIENKDVLSLSEQDSASLGDLPIPKGSEIIVSKEQYKLMSPKEINRLKRRTGAEIVTLQSSEDKNIIDTARRRIEERGYHLLDKFRNHANEKSGNLSEAVKYLGNTSSIQLGDAEYFAPNQLAAELSRIPWLQHRINSLKSGRPVSEIDTSVVKLKKELFGAQRDVGSYFDRTVNSLNTTRRGNPTYKDISSLDRLVAYADSHGASKFVPGATRDYIQRYKRQFEESRSVSRKRKAA